MILTPLIERCAPEVAPVTMSAIVRVESHGDPLAMYDNNTGQEVLPINLHHAVSWLRAAMARGQRVDVGIAQVDTENFRAYGLTVHGAFNACRNLSVGAQILTSAYRKASLVYGPGQEALYHAFEIYNSGRLVGDSSYSRKILASAGIPVTVLANGGLAFRTVQHYHDPFSYRWAQQPGSSYPVDASYRGSASGLGLTRKWG